MSSGDSRFFVTPLIREIVLDGLGGGHLAIPGTVYDNIDGYQVDSALFDLMLNSQVT